MVFALCLASKVMVCLPVLPLCALHPQLWRHRVTAAVDAAAIIAAPGVIVAAAAVADMELTERPARICSHFCFFEP